MGTPTTSTSTSGSAGPPRRPAAAIAAGLLALTISLGLSACSVDAGVSAHPLHRKAAS